LERVKIGITFGDIAGIGPEIIAKALSSSEIRKLPLEFVLFGNTKVWELACGFVPKNARFAPYTFAPSKSALKTVSPHKKNFGKISPLFGAWAIHWIREAVEACKSKALDAMVTAPIHKEACHQSGFRFKGHTDFIAHLCATKVYGMMFYSEPLRVLLVTDHQSLRSAIAGLKIEKVLETIVLGFEAMKQLGVRRPKIAVCGLNPHAGEAGAFGNEEIKILSPAIQKAKEQGIPISGPFPPDTIFHSYMHQKDTLIIAMTHDQGLIPFKLLAFDTGVNMSIGLPIVRTAPDHGTAFDIAWKGKANPSSMIQAIHLAFKLSKR
jgi:4-hydroxythreonine-4-phosphate dehydrogenase